MLHIDTDFSAAATEVRLSPADAWATEVLQRCSRVHYTPQRDLLKILAPLSPPITTSTAADTATATRAPELIDVGAGEDVDVLTAFSCTGSADALHGGNSGGGDSYPPYLPRTIRAAPTAEMQTVRAALSSNLLRKAYRVHILCATSHAAKGERLLNCVASPWCMSGLRTLAGDAATRKECLKVVMGEGPCVVTLPATCTDTAATTGVTAIAVDGASSVNGSAIGDLNGARVPSVTKHVVGVVARATSGKEASSYSSAFPFPTTRTVMHDPTFPCLWRGVRNLMNTCYLSSVLQLVFGVASLRRAILNDGAAEHGDPTTQLEESGLKELFSLMAFSREGLGADPTSFASYLSLDAKIQQDAQEFFTLLLDWLRCHCGPAVQTAVTNTFAGTLLYDRRCGACGRSTKRAEPFLYLSLPVRSTLEDSLSEFSKPEEVDGFTCEGCGKTAVATSRQYIRTLPDVLVIHWNRFKFDLQTLQRHKVTTATSFPLQLDMAAYMRQWHEHKLSGTTTAGGAAASSSKEDDHHCYELRGIVNHHGDTAVSGHYTYHGKVSTSTPPSTTTMDATATWADSKWLNFNDSEVTQLNRYHGQRGVSADAYLLVYHLVPPIAPPSSFASTCSAPPTVRSETATADVSISAAPTPAEFPEYLRLYVDQVNQRCLNARQAWLDQREKVAAFYNLWASTAQAVFETPTSPWKSTPSTATTAPAVFYALPTAWLQQLGRLFLPAYVDVTLGGGAESQLKLSNKDTEGATSEGTGGMVSGEGDKQSGNDLPTAAGALHSPSEEDYTTSNKDALADSAEVPVMGPRCHGFIHSLEELYQLVRQHSLLQALPSLNCSHGYLAPWGAYKLISADAYAKLSHFLSVCGAPLQTVEQAGHRNNSCDGGDDNEGAAADAQTCCALVDSNMCPLCVAAMAATVRGLAVSCAEDEQAELCLTQAWHEAEKKEVEEGNQPLSGEVGGAALKDSAARNCGESERSDNDENEDGEGEGENAQVLVSETLVEGWASYYVNELAWNQVQQTEGYTAVVVMKEARVSPPRALSNTTTSSAGNQNDDNNNNSNTFDKNHRGATSPSSPTSPTNTTTSISPMLISAHHSMGIAAFIAEKGDLDLSSQLLCPHGALRPGQHILAVPATLRRYWLRRFTEILTIAHRTGQLRIADPSWTVTEQDIEHFLLPYIPASTISTTCLECMRTSVRTITSRHHQRLRKMEERKKFPSLWLAGAMTSPAGIAQLLLATGAENEEQLLAAQHPNRLFFKHNAERECREYVKKWTEAQQARIAHQEREVTRLQTAVAKKKEHDAAWNARVTSRRGGRNSGRGGGRGGRHTEINSTTTSPTSAALAPDPETLEGRLFYAVEALTKLRAQPVPDFDVSYGCVPTWWVARWYTVMQDDGPHQKTVAEGGSLSASSGVDAADGGGKERRNEEGEGHAVTAHPLPPISYREFLCEHGGCLLDVPWLNPSDGFWQGVRGKRAEVLWNGVRVERAATAQRSHDGETNRDDVFSSHTAESGPGKAEYQNSCWLPPLVILPIEEYLTLLAQYETPNSPEKPLDKERIAAMQGISGKSTVAAADALDTPAVSKTEESMALQTSQPGGAPSAQSAFSHVPGSIIEVVTHNGVRQLRPAPCAACCARLLATFEANCESFVNGSLKLNIHIRKSRKNFYDAASVLTSAAVQQSKVNEVPAASSTHSSHAGSLIAVPGGDMGKNGCQDNVGQTCVSDNCVTHGDTAPDGIHYYTTLAQLRTYISTHLREKHGYLVPPEDLQIMRGKNKPLKLRSLPLAEKQTETSTAVEHASLQDLGIRDGETLTVQSVDNIAQVCATAPGVEEEWEAIPPELLQAGGGVDGMGGVVGRPIAAAVTREHTAAFRETRLQGSLAVRGNGQHGGGGATSAVAQPATGAVAGSAAASEEAPVACAVCTFVNAPGMAICEMCEAPLPIR